MEQKMYLWSKLLQSSEQQQLIETFSIYIYKKLSLFTDIPQERPSREMHQHGLKSIRNQVTQLAHLPPLTNTQY